jgi:hypothetical protein
VGILTVAAELPLNVFAEKAPSANVREFFNYVEIFEWYTCPVSSAVTAAVGLVVVQDPTAQVNLVDT